jgi:UDP-N-acetylmuramyl pentapeptide phosphotransferase/UDP-N-acetylglucosamine-1-phosphate transferase
LLGILVGYLRFNLSKTNKVFMGDTGSLIIGFCIGFLSLKFLSTDASLLRAHSFNPENSLVIIGAIFFIPLFDTLRVIGVRLLNKKSPFGSDNNHIHHILIHLGLTHFKASLLLCFINVIIATTLILMSSHFTSFEMLCVHILFFIFFLGVFYKLKTNMQAKLKLTT